MVRRITPNLQRITFGGKGMSNFPDNFEGGYAKLNFPQADARIITRTYSILSSGKARLILSLYCIMTGDQPHAGLLNVRLTI